VAVLLLVAAMNTNSVASFSTNQQQQPQRLTVTVRHAQRQTTSSFYLSSSSNPLEVVSDLSSSSSAVDLFESYEQIDSQPLAMKDVMVGTGPSIVESGNLLTLKYKARFVATGKQFDQSESYVCRVGVGKIIPGFDQGLMVRCWDSDLVDLF
jgi:FKBP-type peptidyl-prolyl cis-trans isomerase